MAADGASRHQLHLRLDEVLGPKDAMTLMASLPPDDGTPVVTRGYLDLRLEALEQRLMAAIHREIAVQTRIFVIAMMTGTLTTASLAFAAARLV